MTLYVLKSNTNAIIEICDGADNASTLKDNLIKTGEYKTIDIEEFELNTDTILPLEVVKISGTLDSNGSVTMKVNAYNPTATVTDNLKFAVTANSITYTGFANLTSAEQSIGDLNDITSRLKDWVKEEFKTRLENDNAE